MNIEQSPEVFHKNIISELKNILEPWVSDTDLLNNDDAHLATDLGLDSVGILQVLLGIEKSFGIVIANHELDADLLSTSNLIALVKSKLDENN